MHDRLRAKPPATDAEVWTAATVRNVTERAGTTVVTVADADGEVEVTLDGALYDLFAGRVEGDVVGADCWYK
ncbi:hypothetical protein [Halosegnis marinus]|uniref:Uncharacterized protein n=1 Tax=Halosegnis marinus TaxID=3034023 RepID=A0ABD5ZKK9_9EURY|nr:hypothetical protein [Halosegnis sp. DT85]